MVLEGRLSAVLVLANHHNKKKDNKKKDNKKKDNKKKDISSSLGKLPQPPSSPSSSCHDSSNDNDDESDMTPEAVDPISVIVDLLATTTTTNGDNAAMTSFSVHGHRATVCMGENGAEVTIIGSSSSRVTNNNKIMAKPSSSSSRNKRIKSKSTPKTGRSKLLLELPLDSLLDTASEKPAMSSSSSSSSSSSAAVTSATALPDQSMALICCNHSSFECLIDEQQQQQRSTATNSLAMYQPQQEVERMISILLSDPIGTETWCHGWQAWSYFSSGGQNNNNSHTKDSHTKDSHTNNNASSSSSQSSSSQALLMVKEDLKRVLRNRAFDMNARRHRLQLLRRNLSPFDDGLVIPAPPPPAPAVPATTTAASAAAAAANYKLYQKQNLLVKTRSLPVSVFQQRRRQQQWASATNATDWGNSRLPSSQSPPSISVWDSMQLCAQPSSTFEWTIDGIAHALDMAHLHQENDNDVDTDNNNNDVDVCYDSDPEDFTHGTTTTTLSPTTAATTTASSNEEHETEIDNKENASLPFFPPTSSTFSRKPLLVANLRDDAAVCEKVQEVMNGRYTLIWHCCDRTRNSKVGAPLAVSAWFERGQQLPSLLIQPKFMWRPLPPKQQRGVGDKTSCNTSSPSADQQNYGTDLLDITRVIEVDRIDRTIYPLAKQSCSFFILTLDQKLLFETKTELERNWLVQGIKLMVARLGSKLLVEDHGVFDEYFTIPLESLTGHE